MGLGSSPDSIVAPQNTSGKTTKTCKFIAWVHWLCDPTASPMREHNALRSLISWPLCSPLSANPFIRERDGVAAECCHPKEGCSKANTSIERLSSSSLLPNGLVQRNSLVRVEEQEVQQCMAQQEWKHAAHCEHPHRPPAPKILVPRTLQLCNWRSTRDF